MLIHPAEDALIQHQLPDGSMTTWLQNWSQALRYKPLSICTTHQRHQGLAKQPAPNVPLISQSEANPVNYNQETPVPDFIYRHRLRSWSLQRS